MTADLAAGEAFGALLSDPCMQLPVGDILGPNVGAAQNLPIVHLTVEGVPRPHRRFLQPLQKVGAAAQSMLSRLAPFGAQMLISSLSYGAGICVIQVGVVVVGRIPGPSPLMPRNPERPLAVLHAPKTCLIPACLSLTLPCTAACGRWAAGLLRHPHPRALPGCRRRGGRLGAVGPRLAAREAAGRRRAQLCRRARADAVLDRAPGPGGSGDGCGGGADDIQGAVGTYRRGGRTSSTPSRT